MKLLLIILSILLPTCLIAESDTQELITDRPDQTESSAVVNKNHLQIETGFIIENSESDEYKITSYAYNTTLLRYGLFEDFELRLGLEYLGEDTKRISNNAECNIIGFGPIYTGFKVKIHDEYGYIPEIAFLGGIILPFTADNSFKPDHSAATMRFAFSHSLSETFSLGYNLGAEWDGITAVPAYFYSLALGMSPIENLGFFAEIYGNIYESDYSEHMLDAGFTYSLIPNLQLDLSAGIGLNDYAIDNFISFGLSYRYPQ